MSFLDDVRARLAVERQLADDLDKELRDLESIVAKIDPSSEDSRYKMALGDRDRLGGQYDDVSLNIRRLETQLSLAEKYPHMAATFQDDLRRAGMGKDLADHLAERPEPDEPHK